MILSSIAKNPLIYLLILLFVLQIQSSVALNMKIHPVPRKRNIIIQFGTDGGNPSSEAQALLGISGKKLRRLPHLELDMWRFRLPDSTLPELASAVFVDGALIVTVPKGHDLQGGDNGRGMGCGSGRLVLVQ
ncbi:heat shock protein [Trifolium repens]|nr:heat shock protein [Trifolium repens]